VKKPLGEHYVTVHLTAKETPAKKALENPGSDQVLKDLGGERSGLPFFAFLDEAGKKLADSNALPGRKNLGCPATPEEIAAFGTLLKQTAPRMTEAQRKQITDLFTKVAPKQAGG
jgi:hypothetical protein